MSNETPTLDDVFAQDASGKNAPSVHFGYRLLNCLIDTFFIYILAIIVGIVGFFMGMEGGDLDGIGGMLFGYVIYLIYYYLTEFYLGRSIGKFVTRTTIVTDNGEPLTSRTVFIRSISRLVPFEALSILMSSDMWHDKWSETRVVKSR